MRDRRYAIVAATLCLALVGAACSSTTSGGTNGGADAPDASASNPASTHRSKLQVALGAHVVLTLSATGAAADGRAADLSAATAALEGVSTDAIAELVAGPYGARQAERFAQSWRSHISDLIGYANGRAGGNDGLRDRSLASLLAFSERFGGVLATLTNDALTDDAMAAQVKEYILRTKAAIDVQVDGRPAAFVTEFSKAYNNMAGLAKLLGGTIVAQNQIEGDFASRAAELRATLNDNIGQHVALVWFASTALRARDAATAEAASDALEASNALAVTRPFGTSYGPVGEKAVLATWVEHVRDVVALATATARGNAAAAAAARADLRAYGEAFGGTLAGVIGGLDQAAARALADDHVAALEAVIEAQNGSGAGFGELRAALAHADDISVAVAGAIADDKKF